MTTETPDPVDPFPDVGMGVKRAGIIFAVLAVAYAAVFIFVGASVRATPVDIGASVVLGAALLVLSYIDLRSGLLLDVLTVPLALAGSVYAVFAGDWIFSVAGAVVGYGLIAGLAFYWRKSRGYEGIGLGDAKLLGASGAWVGVAGLPFILLIGSLLGIIAALSVAKKARLDDDRTAIPFGPCLALATWLVWCGIETLIPI